MDMAGSTRGTGNRHRLRTLIACSGRLSGLAFICLLTLLPAHGSVELQTSEAAAMDLVMVMDISGSMGKDQRIERYREVLHWVGGLGRPEDRVGVLTFGNQYYVELELGAVKGFDPALLDRRLENKDKYTDLAAGLEHAYYLLKTTARKNVARWILLFSDGQISLPGGTEAEAKSKQYLRTVLMPAAKREGIRILVFIPDQVSSDWQFLQELAEGTGGDYFRGLPGSAFSLHTLQGGPAVQKTAKVPPPAKPAPVAKLPSTKKAMVTTMLPIGGGAVVLGLATFLVLHFHIRSRRQDQDLVSMLEEVQTVRELMDKQMEERRAHRRIGEKDPNNPVTSLRFFSLLDEEKTLHDGLVLDVSMGGLCMLSSQELAADSTIQLFVQPLIPSGHEDEVTLGGEYRLLRIVRWVKRHDETKALYGIEYLEVSMEEVRNRRGIQQIIDEYEKR